MRHYLCNKCGHAVDIDVPRCTCPSGIPDLRNASEIGSVHEVLYSGIAADDLTNSAQPSQAKLDRAHFDIKKLQRVFPPDEELRILEIGPGDGFLSRLLAAKHNLYVMDITDSYIRGFDFVKGAFVADIETMPFRDEFDVVILCDVLEHVLNEGDALLAVQQALRDGGIAYIRCPSNEPSVSYAQRLGSNYPYVHLRNHSARTLSWVVVHAGFSIIRSGTVRLGPTGYARRDFGFTKLREARATRFTRDVHRAHQGLPGTPVVNRLDWFVDLLEVYTWRIGNFVSRRLTSYLLQRFWYRPAEVYLIGRKRNLNFIDLSADNS